MRRFPLEAGVWAGGLLLMAMLDPNASGETLCLFAQLGIEWCPGCGLGQAIALLARGEWAASVAAHPLAPLVVAGLVVRIATVLRATYIDGPRWTASHRSLR